MKVEIVALENCLTTFQATTKKMKKLKTKSRKTKKIRNKKQKKKELEEIKSDNTLKNKEKKSCSCC